MSFLPGDLFKPIFLGALHKSAGLLKDSLGGIKSGAQEDSA